MGYFADIPAISFEGPDSRNPFAYRYYDAERSVLGKSMRDHLRWAVCYWHTFAWPGHDIFGAGTFDRPWRPGEPVTAKHAQTKLDAAFDMFSKLGAPFYCFHDVDAIADYENIAGYSRELDTIAAKMADKISQTGV
ncbi:MAG: xylose isomerase, partial [Pseudomonadota bacterium]